MESSGQQFDPTTNRHQRVARLLLFAGLALLLVITLFPIAPNLDVLVPVTDLLASVGVPAAIAGTVLEAILNVLMFVPLSLLLALYIFPARLWWVAIAASAAVSLGVELVQAVALPGRSASVIDLAANSTGGAIGAAAAGMLHRARARRIAKPARDRPLPDDGGP